jgi:hypothetical protein
MEEWRPIPIAPCYAASSLGRIKVIETGQIMKPWKRKDGYFQICLRRGQPKNLYRKVSQLICMAFHGPAPFAKAVSAHKDGTRDNDIPDNLYWATHKQNHADRETHQRAPKGSRNGRAALREDDIGNIREMLRGGLSIELIADTYGVCKATISHINTGRNWSHV